MSQGQLDNEDSPYHAQEAEGNNTGVGMTLHWTVLRFERPRGITGKSPAI